MPRSKTILRLVSILIIIHMIMWGLFAIRRPNAYLRPMEMEWQKNER